MTAVLDKAETEPVTQKVETHPVASWPSRAGAFSLDVFLGLGVLVSLALVALTFPLYSRLWWGCVGVAALVAVPMAANRLLLPARAGHTSFGRAVFGIEIIRAGSGDTPGTLRLLARDLAHVLDTAALFVGWMWPLWDSRNRTFADLLLRTEARRVERPRQQARRIAAIVVVAATAIAAAGASLSYLTVYRHDLAVERARTEIKDQGPQMVQSILGFGAATRKDDFARAQALVTDEYRPQLLHEQEAAEKRPPANNELWAVANSVLSVTPDRATMLIFLQGQRGVQEEDIRFISATVRVEFEKSADKWRISDLTVLSRPMATGGGG